MPFPKEKIKFSCFALTIFLMSVILSGCSVVTSNSSALQVTTKPDSSLFLNGKLIGKTPYFSDQFKSGTYTLKITTSDASYSVIISLNPRTLTVVNRDLASNILAQAGEVLTLKPNLSGLSVVSNPQGADLIVDGTQVGKTPILIPKISDGDHKLSLFEAGYITREFVIKTTKAYQLQSEVTLASEAAKGLGISSPPPQTSEQVEILNTPQGFLRVRTEPSIEASETGRVNVGNQYEIIQEIPDWVKISFDGKMGWVSSQFTKKVQQ